MHNILLFIRAILLNYIDSYILIILIHTYGKYCMAQNLTPHHLPISDHCFIYCLTA